MTYRAFWHRYLRAHAKPSTRLVHYAGSIAALACLLGAAVLLDWRLLIAAPMIGYACAWTAHAAIEGNRPETFGHPFWSLFSDFRMLGLWIAGRLSPHLDTANKEGSGNAGAFALSGEAHRET